MKARVKATGEIVEIVDIDFDTLFCKNGGHYTPEQLEGIECEPDYWTRLEHQYAGMAMQGILTNPIGFESLRARGGNLQIETALLASEFAHALVEELKQKEERK